MNRNIVIAILVVIVIAVVVFTMFSQPATNEKINTQFEILSNNTLANGDQVQFLLKGGNGDPIAGEKVKVGLTTSAGDTETSEVTTDSDGKGVLTLKNQDAGTHNVELSYGGNDKYIGCAFTVSITVEDA